MKYDKAVVAELLSLVIVTDDDENEDKSEWDDDPQYGDTFIFRGVYTGPHRCL